MWQHLVEKIERQLQDYANRGLKSFVTSSFQTHSIPLLHIVSQIDPGIPVYFLDTGFHFPETRKFRNQIANRLGFKLVNVCSPIEKYSQKDVQGQFFFASDPDQCCHMNKVLPLEPLLRSFDVWITGVRRDQTRFRRDLQEEVEGRHDTVKYHPMLEWTPKMILEYRSSHSLPEHPLESLGYSSVGCMPCTRTWIEQTDHRDGRWSGMKKKECGIHSDFSVTK